VEKTVPLKCALRRGPVVVKTPICRRNWKSNGSVIGATNGIKRAFGGKKKFWP